MTPLEQQILEIELFGFTIIPEVLTAAEAAHLREVMKRLEREQGTDSKHRGTARHVSNLTTLDRAFHPLIDHAKVLPVLEHFLGQGLILGSLNSRIVTPGDGYQGLHSDIPGHMLNPVSPVMMNTVWALDDFSPANGGTRLVPGSHKSGLVEPPAGFTVRHEVQPAVPAGTVIVFNGQCWHGGGANQTQANRHALFGHYRKSMLIFQVDPHDKFPPEWYEGLNPRQRQLLRMRKGLGAPHASDSHGAV